MNRRVAQVPDAVLGSGLSVSAFGLATRGVLRILAYHGIEDTGAFDRQMAYLAQRYAPVPSDRAASALRGDDELPERAVWVTFDDGSPTVVERALPILTRYGIPSTMFVCPAVIDTETPFWWQTVEQGWSAGIRPPAEVAPAGSTLGAVVAHLKTVPDQQRRDVVARLAQGFSDATGAPPRRKQITSEQIRYYLDRGGTLGNHTWDHPCLDRCWAVDASEQVTRAHHELVRRFGVTPTVFAYPNGNASLAAEQALVELGYDAAVLFDHALTRRDGSPMYASRLRVGDHNSQARFRAIVAGAHPALSRLRSRVTVTNVPRP